MKLVFLLLATIVVSVVICLDPSPNSILKNAKPHELAAHLEKCKNLHEIDDTDIRNEYLQRGSAGKNMKPFHACVAKAMGLVRFELEIFYKSKVNHFYRTHCMTI